MGPGHAPLTPQPLDRSFLRVEIPTEAFPVIPVPDGHALSVGIFSYRDCVCFSGYADPGALPEAASLPGALNASLLELSGRAGSRAARRPLAA